MDFIQFDYDCVVFLTMSDWKTESKSNRYHYASRFSKLVPTFFVQFDSLDSKVSIEFTELENLFVIHAPKSFISYDPNLEIDLSLLPEFNLIINSMGGSDVWFGVLIHS